MIRVLSTACILVALAAATPLTADAQLAGPESAATGQSTRTAADRLSTRQAGISRDALDAHARRAEAAPASVTAALAQSRARRGQTLMIVGGAAFLAGLIIGDAAGTAIAVGGAAIGLYGLYLWAQ